MSKRLTIRRLRRCNETTAEVLGGLAKAYSTMRTLGRSLALTRHSFWFRFNAPRSWGARF